MSQTVRVPDPIYECIERESDRKDVAKGVIVQQWKDKADKYDRLEVQ